MKLCKICGDEWSAAEKEPLIRSIRQSLTPLSELNAAIDPTLDTLERELDEASTGCALLTAFVELLTQMKSLYMAVNGCQTSLGQLLGSLPTVETYQLALKPITRAHAAIRHAFDSIGRLRECADRNMAGMKKFYPLKWVHMVEKGQSCYKAMRKIRYLLYTIEEVRVRETEQVLKMRRALAEEMALVDEADLMRLQNKWRCLAWFFIRVRKWHGPKCLKENEELEQKLLHQSQLLQPAKFPSCLNYKAPATIRPAKSPVVIRPAHKTGAN